MWFLSSILPPQWLFEPRIRIPVVSPIFLNAASQRQANPSGWCAPGYPDTPPPKDLSGPLNARCWATALAPWELPSRVLGRTMLPQPWDPGREAGLLPRCHSPLASRGFKGRCLRRAYSISRTVPLPPQLVRDPHWDQSEKQSRVILGAQSSPGPPIWWTCSWTLQASGVCDSRKHM